MKSDDFKNLTDGAKNIHDIIKSTLEKSALDKAIEEGHKKIIEEMLLRPDIDNEDKIIFLSSYKHKVKEYKNCKKVISIAKPLFSKNANMEDVEDDWFAFFFDKVRLVSEESAQNLWARILAGEVNEPGKFTKSLIHTLSVMSSSQAQAFCDLAQFCFGEPQNDNVHPLVFMKTNKKMYKNSISLEMLFALQYFGLLQCNFESEFVFQNKKVFKYGDCIITVYGDESNRKQIRAGNIVFTHDGQILFNIVSESYKTFQHNILDSIVNEFIARNCKVFVGAETVRDHLDNGDSSFVSDKGTNITE